LLISVNFNALGSGSESRKQINAVLVYRYYSEVNQTFTKIDLIEASREQKLNCEDIVV
jgi:hypothetical protein